MKRSELEKHIGESVEVKLFDGDTMQGVLRKTGTEEVRNNPNLYLKGGYYFLSHKDTALLAIKIAGTDTAERIKELKGRIQELKKLRTEISKEIYSLTPIHKAIICGFYLQGQKWERIAEQISYSVRQSKNIRCVALEVLGGKLARNRNISRSKILKEVLH